MTFLFPEAVAELISKRWTDSASSATSHPSAQPSQSVLTALLNNCFFASLKREEDRTTEFDLALCLPSDLPDPAFRFSNFVKFFNLISFDHRELSVDELVRLAPACNPEKTVILTGYDSKTDDLYLWGVVDVGSRSSATVTHGCLTELGIRVSSLGEMKVSLHGGLLCTYKDGKILYPERKLINTGRIYDFFRPTSLDLCHDVKVAAGQEAGAEPDDGRDYRAMAYLFALQELVERMQRLKHGGCILIVPEEQSDEKFSNLTVKYPCRCRDQTVWNCLRGKWILHDQFFAALDKARAGECNAEEVQSLQSQREDVERGLTDSLDTLVRFTAVDGALLITRKFEVLGFGAVVQLPSTAPYAVRKCEDREGTRAADIGIELFGTRHRSAFQFCYDCAPSVAIVVSQDGGVKMVMRVDDAIYFWENLSFDCSTE